MTILEAWKSLAYSGGLNDKRRENLWAGYFTIERGTYEKTLSNPMEVIKGTVKELAERYGIEVLIMARLLDGTNKGLKGYGNPVDIMKENTVVKTKIDPEKLYYNVVEARADWLYNLSMQEDILPVEKRKELYKEQKEFGTIVKGPEAGRNDPCPCGSGLKYRKCCSKSR